MDSLMTTTSPTTVQPRGARPESAHQLLTVRHVRHSAGVEVCAPVGEIDLYTAPLLRRALRDAEQRQIPRLFVDLTQVGFLALAGVRVLTTAAQRAQATQRQLALIVATRPVQRALQVTGALDALATYECLSDAVTALSVPEQPRMVAAS